MRILALFALGVLPLYADGSIAFQIGGRSYRLTGAHALIAQRHGKTQVIVGVKDTEAKAQFAFTAELASTLTGPVELSPETVPITAMIVTPQGFYSFVPAVTLVHDEFMRYTKKEELVTGELEDDPNDNGDAAAEECRRNNLRDCERIAKTKRRKRPKVIVKYSQHSPTWLGKSREQRITQGDGVAIEEKYRDTALLIRLTPTIVDGKVTHLTGSFAGTMLYSTSPNSATRVPLQAGTFSVTVKVAE